MTVTIIQRLARGLVRYPPDNANTEVNMENVQYDLEIQSLFERLGGCSGSVHK